MIQKSVSLLGLCLLMLLGQPVIAQDKKETDSKKPTKPVFIPRGILPAGWGKIGLSPEQANKIREIRGINRARINALKKQIEEIRQEEIGQMAKFLTPAQIARLKEIKPGIKLPPELDNPTKKPTTPKTTTPNK